MRIVPIIVITASLLGACGSEEEVTPVAHVDLTDPAQPGQADGPPAPAGPASTGPAAPTLSNP